MAQINYRVNAILQTKGDLAAQMAKKTAAVGGLGSAIDVVSGKLRAVGASMAGSAYQTGAAFAKAGLMGAGAAVGTGIGVIAAKSFQANAGAEAMRNTLAGTLQLYGHSAGKADQLASNVSVAAAAMVELQRVADAAPGGIDDIKVMFQNMLPGARAVTGQMQRIMALTQNLALFTPTLTGGDFMTSGAQLGRILTGSAGAEMDTWKRLAPVVLKAGKEMDKIGGRGKVFGANMVDAGEKLTMEFNKLSGPQRLALIEKAFAAGGPQLAKMYEDSWEGASATFISGWKKIGAAGTAPMFNGLKAAMIKATRGDDALFGKQQINRFLHAADTIGRILERPFMRGVKMLEDTITYLDQNWKQVANTVYHAIQLGGAAIKAAFAVGVAKLIGGLALAGAGGAFGAATKGFGAVKKGLAVTRPVAQKAADSVSGFFAALTFGSSSLFKMSTALLPSLLGLAFAMVPLVALGAAAMFVFGGLAVIVGGIAAYVVSKWDEIAGSIRKGLEDGTVTLKPLITAALILWEKLKAVGAAFLGGTTGADMMQGAINFATKAVEFLTDAVVLLLQGVAMFMDFVATSVDTIKTITDPKYATGKLGEDAQRVAEIMRNEGVTDKTRAIELMQSRKAQGAYGEVSFGDRMRKTADSLRAAARAASEAGLKNLDFESVEAMTKKAEDNLKKLLGGDTPDTKNPKGATTNIGTLNMNVDLREKDPDRLMRGLFEPIQQLARAPTASAYDGPGF